MPRVSSNARGSVALDWHRAPAAEHPVDLPGEVRARTGVSTVLVEHEVDGSGGDGRPRGTTDLLQRTDTADARGAARPGPALGLVGGHPLGAVGLSAAFGGSEVVAVGSGALPPRSVVVADLTCSGCSPATADLAQLARQHRLVLLVGQGQVGLAEEALADGALCSVGAWEPVAELRRAVAAAAAGTPWVSPSAAAAGAQVREVRGLLSRCCASTARTCP